MLFGHNTKGLTPRIAALFFFLDALSNAAEFGRGVMSEHLIAQRYQPPLAKRAVPHRSSYPAT
jgi:hypothetical protein